MKRFVKFICVLLVLATLIPGLVACVGASTQLTVPENVRVENGFILWNSVNNATKYTVKVDGEMEYSTESTLLKIANTTMTPGSTYVIEVKACGNGTTVLDSSYSTAIVYNYVDEDNEITIEKSDPVNGKLAAYVANPESDLKFVSAINDSDTYHVYYFYLGNVLKTPIYHSTSIYYDKDVDVRFHFSKTNIEHISTTLSKTTELISSFNISTTLSSEISVGTENGVNLYDIVGSKITTNLSVAKQKTWTSGFQAAFSTFEEQTQQYTTELVENFEIDISLTEAKGFEKGYNYRLGIYDNIDAYAVVVYDVKKNEYSVAYQQFLTGERQVVVEESKAGTFEYGMGEKKMSFDMDKAIKYIQDNKPLENIETGNEHIVAKKDSLVYDLSPKTVTQDGYWGLGNKSAVDTINFSEYRQYFNDDYIFYLKLSVKAREKHDGYQEIYLYDSTNASNGTVKSTTSEMNAYEARENYGMVRGSMFEHGSGKLDKEASTHIIEWYVRGSEITDTMYIRYDAQGTDDDTWYRDSLMVDLVIVQKSKSVNMDETFEFDSKITVNSTGVLGLNASRTRETLPIHTEAWDAYKNSGYIFVFDVTVNLNEKNNGYQEIYLYTGVGSTSSTDSENVIWAQEYGYLAGYMLSHSPNKVDTSPADYSFNWIVNGASITDEMNIRYDAQGENSDTWYKNNLTVTVTVFKVPEAVNDKDMAARVQ